MLDISGAQAWGFGTPISLGLILIGFIARQYFLYKKDSREETKSDRASESGIVETTNAVLVMVRKEIAEYEKVKKDQDQRLKEQDLEIKRLNKRVTALELENTKLKLGSP